MHERSPELAERRARALRLLTAGATFEQIARELGYSNRGNAYRDVQRALREVQSPAVNEYRALQTLRLEALWLREWVAYQGRPEDGVPSDYSRASTLLAIHDRIARLHGLNAPSEVDLSVRPAAADVPPEEAEARQAEILERAHLKLLAYTDDAGQGGGGHGGNGTG